MGIRPMTRLSRRVIGAGSWVLVSTGAGGASVEAPHLTLVVSWRGGSQCCCCDCRACCCSGSQRGGSWDRCSSCRHGSRGWRRITLSRPADRWRTHCPAGRNMFAHSSCSVISTQTILCRKLRTSPPASASDAHPSKLEARMPARVSSPVTASSLCTSFKRRPRRRFR